jgi:FKBP-type peptidyl-prolyl cis-trans isomerase
VSATPARFNTTPSTHHTNSAHRTRAPPQVVVNYVAYTPEGRIFENSLEKSPFDIRVGAGQVLPGLDEGLSTMKVRRMALLTGWRWCTVSNQPAD